jgi:hypothetical protein
MYIKGVKVSTFFGSCFGGGFSIDFFSASASAAGFQSIFFPAQFLVRFSFGGNIDSLVLTDHPSPANER